MKLYQVNAKGLQPYWTDGKLDALIHYSALKAITSKCSIRQVDFHKAIYKIYHK